MARPQLRKTYTWDKPEEIIDLNSFWFQIRRNRHVPCHLPAKDNRKPCTKCRGQPSGGCDWAVGVTEELRPARRGAPWPLVIVSFVDVCLLSRMFVCFFSFYKCQPTSHSSWQPGTAVGADPVPEGQPLLGALLWTWKVVTLWDGALLTIHILLQAHRARSRASNCPMPPPHWTLQNPGGRAQLTVSARH